ncbi:MAG: AIR synthase-related protein [bacterium]|nr:AIR synthase-related protein [bacterium]
MDNKLTYSGSGVDYNSMDPFKRFAQKAAQNTSKNIERFNFKELPMSRGESVYLIETPNSYIAHVEEGLGTKNIVADKMYKLTGKSFYKNIAQDAVAAIVNDLITLGALPISVAMHLAVGNSNWFNNEKLSKDLIDGWEHACNLSKCVWGGGETPTLKDIVYPETAVISGSAVGIIQPKERIITADIQDGDVIVLIESSGIHANGLTLARKIAENLPDGYLTKLEDGRTYGETLLDQTIIYVPLIEDCLNNEINIHYTVNITGHGWRKLMRATKPFIYTIENILVSHPVFEFIQQHSQADDKEMYGNFNMGAGFAIYVPEKDAEKVVLIAKNNNLKAWIAGNITKSSNDKKVIIKPKNIVFEGFSLGVR